jgi:aldose 1-epimerase
MKLEKRIFGRASGGQEVELFTLESSTGIRAELMTYGAALRSFRLPGRDGAAEEITLGFDTLAEYEADRRFFGATVGRFANRIGGGRFFLDGIPHAVTVNSGRHHLHGGAEGFDRRVWEAQSFARSDMATVLFSRVSPDGEEGYPGELRISVAYTLTDGGELSLAYEAETTETTPVNPTNHTFWNLAGAGKGTIEDHELRLDCPFYLPVDDELIPTGEILSVRGTPMDFTRSRRIGGDIGRVKPDGYDHCYAVGAAETELAPAAVLRDPESGRTMEVLTTLPGVQFYSGNMLKAGRGAGGIEIRKRGAVCLETGFFPDSPNKPHFRSPVLRPGETYRSMTLHRFRIT